MAVQIGGRSVVRIARLLLQPLSSLQGIAISIFVQSWSVMVRIESYPADSGSFTIKSIDMVWNGNAPIAGVIGFSGAF